MPSRTDTPSPPPASSSEVMSEDEYRQAYIDYADAWHAGDRDKSCAVAQRIVAHDEALRRQVDRLENQVQANIDEAMRFMKERDQAREANWSATQKCAELVRERDEWKAAASDDMDCICGCPQDEHETYEEGQGCEHEDHWCLFAPISVGVALRDAERRVAELETKLSLLESEIRNQGDEYPGCEFHACPACINARALLAGSEVKDG